MAAERGSRKARTIAGVSGMFRVEGALPSHVEGALKGKSCVNVGNAVLVLCPSIMEGR